jgi:5'-nucleotidase
LSRHALSAIIARVPTHTENPPLILITNDDGIQSPGLRAAVEAALPLGEILVLAPNRQWSGAGRSMPRAEGRITPFAMEIDGQPITAYETDASPALIVIYALHELVPRSPALVISGINYGENLGSDVTISGTVGAALQAAVCGIPALAASLQTPKETHTKPCDSIDFGTAIHFTRLFARRLLETSLPFDADVLKLDVPDDATPETPWRLTHASRQPYFVTVPPKRADLSNPLTLDYESMPHPELTEPDSDIYALAADRVISVAPLSIDLTTRADFDEIETLLRPSPTLTRRAPVL